jgi:hypothetical protein
MNKVMCLVATDWSVVIFSSNANNELNNANA